MASDSKKRGRKPTITEQMHKGLLRYVANERKRRNLTKRGGVKAILTDAITDLAKKRGESVTKALKMKLPYWQKRYANAKRKFPEFA